MNESYYRNVFDIIIEGEDIIEAGSLFIRTEKGMLLVDEDRVYRTDYDENLFDETTEFS